MDSRRIKDCPSLPSIIAKFVIREDQDNFYKARHKLEDCEQTLDNAYQNNVFIDV